MISLIQNKVSAQGTNHEKAFIRSVLRLSRELSKTPEEILEMPIPQYLTFVENIVEEDNKRKNGK